MCLANSRSKFSPETFDIRSYIAFCLLLGALGGDSPGINTLLEEAREGGVDVGLLSEQFLAIISWRTCQAERIACCAPSASWHLSSSPRRVGPRPRHTGHLAIQADNRDRSLRRRPQHRC